MASDNLSVIGPTPSAVADISLKRRSSYDAQKARHCGPGGYIMHVRSPPNIPLPAPPPTTLSAQSVPWKILNFGARGKRELSVSVGKNETDLGGNILGENHSRELYN